MPTSHQAFETMKTASREARYRFKLNQNMSLGDNDDDDEDDNEIAKALDGGSGGSGEHKEGEMRSEIPTVLRHSSSFRTPFNLDFPFLVCLQGPTGCSKKEKAHRPEVSARNGGV